MVGKMDYSSVPTAVDLENKSNLKKYSVNRKPGGLVISKPLCALMAIGTILLAILVGLIVFFLVPRCSEASPGAYSKSTDINSDASKASLHNITSHTSDDGLLSNTPSTFMIREIDERLPRNVEPIHYRIQIMPFLHNLTMSGTVTMTLNVKQETNEIIFHVKNIEIDKGSVKVTKVGNNNNLKISSQEYIEGEKYRIILDENLSKNVMHTVEIMYTAHLDNHLQGFYRSGYEDVIQNTNDFTTMYLASTQFSPTDARRAFPCFDEPSFKANFSIIIGRPSNMFSLSNMPLTKKNPDPIHKDLVWDYYETTPKMSTYLVAFVVSDLQGYGSSDKLIKMWSRRSLSNQTSYAAEFAPKVLRFFEDYFQIKFPLPKIDIVAIPDFGYSAMENWGLITFRESAILYDYYQSNIDNKRDIATILSHELGHQWFGNLVTPKWWNDLWLKEGFATYLVYLGTNVAEPSWKIADEFIISETTRAFALDALESSRPISFQVKNNRQIRQTFDELSYAKGACIIRMMNHFLGEKSFKNGLISFLKQHQYGNADRDDLFTALTEEAHKNGALDKSITVKDVMDSWTKQPGFPVITAIRDYANKKLILKQKRFLFTDNEDDNSTWWVPISLVTEDNQHYENTTPTVWLKNEPSITINLNISKDKWYLLNINQTGYFIVNYNEDNWKLLTERIMDIPPLIRAQLISDSMDLARANLLDYSIPLKLIARMAIHDHNIMFVPTYVALKKLEFLSDILFKTPAYGLLEEFQWTIFKQRYAQVFRNKNYDEEYYLNQRIRRTILSWACRKTDSECAIWSHHMFRNWMETGEMVPTNLRQVVYCTAIRQGTDAEWKFARLQYLKTTSVSEKNVILDALGCTIKKPWLLSRYLDLLVQNQSSVRIQDADRVFKAVADNSLMSSMAFDFLRMNWNKLITHYGEGFNIISKMVKNLPRYMNSEYQLKELIRFRDEIRGNIGTASLAFDSTIEKVKGNVVWMKNNYKFVEMWISDFLQNFNPRIR